MKHWHRQACTVLIVVTINHAERTIAWSPRNERFTRKNGLKNADRVLQVHVPLQYGIGYSNFSPLKRGTELACLPSEKQAHVSSEGSKLNLNENTRQSSEAFSTFLCLELNRLAKSVASISLWLVLIFSPLIVTSTLNEAADASELPSGKRYWSIMETEPRDQRIAANEALLDYAVGTINTQFYDNTGGAMFAPKDFYNRWKEFKQVANQEQMDGRMTTLNSGKERRMTDIPIDSSLDSRDGAVRGLRYLIGSLNDPFSKYLTREELRQELQEKQDGFLGIGAIAEPSAPSNYLQQYGPQTINGKYDRISLSLPSKIGAANSHRLKKFLTNSKVDNLPIITAVAPNSPAERGGLTVGDRIVAVGNQQFLGWTKSQVETMLRSTYNSQSYIGQAKLSVAKPVFAFQDQRNVVIGYRQTKVSLPTASTEPWHLPDTEVAGGDACVQYQLLPSSIFDHMHSDDAPQDDYKVGYIRLTRFSKATSTGYLNAVDALESAGAKSYILDLRNNYGGVIQEAMLTASTLLRDPHAILCYTMNARGGFTPHDVEEYIVDKRFPGYLLSSEARSATLQQVQRENPAMFKDNGIAWDPPSSFASLHEQVVKRGIRRISFDDYYVNPLSKQQRLAQKKIVILINEGTASAAEIFAAALHDNGRVAALVGTKTYGKGLIQHTFPMPDGGGLRITVAEYLTPALRHVTNVGSARYDRETGEFVGGGIRPDIFCDSKQGIPRKIGADLCVGVALDAIEEATIDIDDINKGINGIGESSQLIVRR